MKEKTMHWTRFDNQFDVYKCVLDYWIEKCHFYLFKLLFWFLSFTERYTVAMSEGFSCYWIVSYAQLNIPFTHQIFTAHYYSRPFICDVNIVLRGQLYFTVQEA